MSTVDEVREVRPNDMPQRVPTMTQKYGNTTYEVYVHFSQTSKETLTDKVIRLIRNDSSGNIS